MQTSQKVTIDRERKQITPYIVGRTKTHPALDGRYNNKWIDDGSLEEGNFFFSSFDRKIRSSIAAAAALNY